jgi:ADP-dependent NAD(P)H-hydrate dehydratase / NAD(P)H-hydrate epimerase
MMSGLPILTAEQMRTAEQAAADHGTPLSVLMQRAGRALGRLAHRVASGRAVHILVGPGNNGGDGYVAAQWLVEQGVVVTLTALAPPATDLARAAAAQWTGPVGRTDAEPVSDAILIDCLFGTGLNRALSAEAAGLLSRHAALAHRVIAADLPSGVNSDSGALLGCPIRADITLAFAALKPAHVLLASAMHSGEVRIADIGISCVSAVRLAALPELAGPDASSHKYTRGLVAVVAGSMGGAAELAARAAQRSGAGYVRLIGSSLPPSAPWSLVRQGWRDGAPLADPRIGAVVIGCGLGSGESAKARLEATLNCGKPLVIDADALALLPGVPLTMPAILTPHVGEFDRIAPDLTGSKIDRTRALAARTGAVVLHKGADSVIAAPDGRVAIAPQGSHWLASAGTGDVLAGICGAMLARGLEPFEAAQAAVLLHHRAAERAGPGLIADDLIEAGIWP